MADTLGEGGFWLPSEFLTDDDDDILIDKEKLNKVSSNTAHGPNFCFPTEFPYDWGSFGSSSALSSPVESVFGSTETESDEEDLLSGLTRHLARSTLQQTQQIGFNPQKTEKTWVFSGSPQSTLSAVRSWSGHGSPNGPSPATPLSPQNDAWDLIYAAAGQVSRLKMNCDGPPPRGGRLVLPHRRITPATQPSLPVENPNTGFYANQHMSGHFQQVRHEQCSANWGRQAKQVFISNHNQFQNPQFVYQNRGERVTGGFHHHHRQNPPPPPHGGSGMRAVFLGGDGVKKQCAGTGVFLPRGYGNTSDNSRKNPGCSTALIPARVVQSLNKSFEELTGQPQPQPQHRINGALTPNYDVLLAQRNAMLAQQRRSIWPKGAINHEMVLPQEWTY